jgi:hypothetical protein
VYVEVQKSYVLITVHVPTVLKLGCLNLLEPSGPVKACNDIALPLPFTYNSTDESGRTEAIMVTNILPHELWNFGLSNKQ